VASATAADAGFGTTKSGTFGNGGGPAGSASPSSAPAAGGDTSGGAVPAIRAATLVCNVADAAGAAGTLAKFGYGRFCPGGGCRLCAIAPPSASWYNPTGPVQPARKNKVSPQTPNQPTPRRNAIAETPNIRPTCRLARRRSTCLKIAATQRIAP
jgi:hypothetical protein